MPTRDEHAQDGRLPDDAPARHEPVQTRVAITRLRRRVHIPRRVRGLISRARLDALIDRVRLHIDAFPHGIYQPVDVLPVRTATRADGSVTRWAAMRGVVQRLGVRSAIDVGSNAGYFSLKLGAMGIPTLAVDPEPAHVRTASLAVRRSGLDNVGVLGLALSADTADLFGPMDCVVFLSVWHHFVAWHGLDYATAMLSLLWDRTRKVMFFDTGENEMPGWFGLPAMEPDGRTWLTEYLSALPGSRIEHLGTHAAFDAEGLPAERNLFAIIRTAPHEP